MTDNPSHNSNEDPDIFIPTSPILTLLHPTIPTSIITLRPHLPTDAPTLVRHCNNPKIFARMSARWSYPYELHHAESFIAQACDTDGFVASGAWDPERGDGVGRRMPVSYAVCVDGEVVGAIGLGFFGDVRLRTANLGYWLGEDVWYQGIMSKVAPAFVEWAWGNWGRLVRLEGGVYAGNSASCKVLEKCGLKHVYLARKSVFKSGKDLDAEVYASTRED